MNFDEREQLRISAIGGHAIVWTPAIYGTEIDQRDPQLRERTALALLRLHVAVVEITQFPDRLFTLAEDDRQVLKNWRSALNAVAIAQQSEYYRLLADPLELIAA